MIRNPLKIKIIKMKKIWIFLAIGLIFIIGYFLRTYFELNSALPKSPYEAYKSRFNSTVLNRGIVKDFSDKTKRYPTTLFFQNIINPVTKRIYLIYIIGSVIFFFLGKELTEKNIGGLFSFSLFAVSHENLIQYTKTIGSAGLSYVSMWMGLLFLILYIKKRKNLHLALFIISFLISITSYHTGAIATSVISLGLIISLILSKQHDKKIIISLTSIILFHLIWIFIFDISQIITIKRIIMKTSFLKIILIIFFLVFVLKLSSKFKKIKINFDYPIIISLIISTMLIFLKIDLFGFLLRFGPKNYYSSSITLNNYIAQTLLTHIYLLSFIPVFLKKKLDKNKTILRGWFIGVLIISINFIFANYYSRILDYTFPLNFLLFAIYWSKKEKYRLAIVVLTIFLLIISQIKIYNDPFTMRRYYTQSEIDSAKSIILLNLDETIASDFRTSALFSYLGQKNIKYGEEGKEFHETLFYHPEKIKNLDVNYLILSNSMKNIVYAQNFETTPINDSLFQYYRNNFKEIYNDDFMYVYKIK